MTKQNIQTIYTALTVLLNTQPVELEKALQTENKAIDKLTELLNETPKELEIELSGIDSKDYPKFCDAMIETAYVDGLEIPTEIVENLDSDKINSLIK